MKRIDIKTGYLCNNNCRFCVQSHNKHLGNRTLAQIKKSLDEARTSCDGVVFTGGEVTIRPDFLDMVEYAKKSGFSVIQIQTNGRMLSNKDFCKKVISAGATEFSPALHGHLPEIHDFLTRAKGSFIQTVKGIKNLKELNQIVIMNSVVCKPNYRKIPELAKLFVKLKVDQFQFAFMHAVGNADKNFDSMMPRVSLAEPFIKRGLQIGIDNGIMVMAEAMPYCVMKGYEDYVAERYMPETEIREGDNVTESFREVRLAHGKMKFEKCKNCKYDDICEGPWREYPERMGETEFVPVTR